MKRKMTLKEAKKMLKRKAKKEFPEIPKDYWYFSITEWNDGDFRLEYIHNFSYEGKDTNPETNGRITIEYRQATDEY